MEASSLGSAPRTKKWRKPVSTLVIAALVLAAIFGIYSYYHNKNNPSANAGTEITQKQISDAETKGAEQALKDKNYKAAADNYYNVATTEYGNKNYTKAKSILQNAIQKIPDKYVGWYVYESLAQTAKALDDKTLEKSSWQTAINKASQPDSGADQGTIDLMKKQLQGL